MYKKEFENLIGQCIEKYNLKGKTAASYSTFQDFNYQTSILFCLAKNPEKNKIIQDVVDFVKASGLYSKVEITGNGFLSVKVELKHFLNKFESQNKRVIVDYCGANVAKKMHVGHIRSMFIGDFITRLNIVNGNIVHRVNHIGDWGNQFGFLLQYIVDKNIDVVNNQQLTEIYKKATELNKENEEFKLKAEARAVALQSKEPETMFLWEKCCKISMKEMTDTFEDFGLLMRETDGKGESFYAEFCPEVEKMLLDAGVAQKETDGSVIVPDSNPKKSPLVIKKSTGAYLYAMYDLAAIHYRVNLMDFNPDEIFYVVDKRQALHFEQVFAAAQKMGWGKDCKFTHIGFGTILGKDKKPLKTRSGESLYLDDLLEEGFAKVLELEPMQKIENHAYKDLVVKDTLYGALKYYDLHFAVNTDYVFDWDSILSLKGNSAPYLQNAFVRIDSIMDMNNHLFNNEDYITGFKNPDLSILSQSAMNLFFETQKTMEVIDGESVTSLLVCEQAMELCKSFHNFYEHTRLNKMGDEEKKNYLFMLHIVQIILRRVSVILGIKLYPCLKRFEKSFPGTFNSK